MYGVSQAWISTPRYWCVLHTFPYSKGIFCLWTLNMRSIFQILWQNAFNISAGLINLSHLFCSLFIHSEVLIRNKQGLWGQFSNQGDLWCYQDTDINGLVWSWAPLPSRIFPQQQENPERDYSTTPDHQPVRSLHVEFSDFSSPLFHCSALV